MKEVVLSLFSRQTPDNKPSPKSYPFYKELVELLKNDGWYALQVGVKEEPDIGASARADNLSPKELKELAKETEYFIAVDNFFPHLMQCYNPNIKGIVIFGKSEPRNFGYFSNLNLVKDEKFLRKGAEAFCYWDNVKNEKAAFVSPDAIMNRLKEIYKG